MRLIRGGLLTDGGAWEASHHRREHGRKLTPSPEKKIPRNYTLNYLPKPKRYVWLLTFRAHFSNLLLCQYYNVL
jgi:hypothetical protein